MSRSLVIGGVPEHFNLPWYLAIEQGKFLENQINIEWKDFPSGTGAMCKALREKEIDIAVLLTEGIVADIIKGNPSKIIQIYIKSPLLWGIHTSANSSYQSIEELEGRKVAISRLGSGSHLMAYVDAQQRGWELNQDQLVVVGNLKGGIEALQKGEADLFMWEKFMTKPYVDKGELRRLEVCPTPWPCFVIAVRDEIIEHNYQLLKRLLRIIHQSCAAYIQTTDFISQVAERFNLLPIDAQEWFEKTIWALDNHIQLSDFQLVINKLYELDFIPELVNPLSLFAEKMVKIS
jgi:ABC-type nitrate/sulfonate/bicarbonate transport system substrate-binding protein